MLKNASPKTAYSFIMPAMIIVFLCSLIPNLYSMYIAFTNYSLYHYTNFQFVGFKNFITIITQNEVNTFVRVFIWTFSWAIISVVGMLAIGLLLAIILNTKDFKTKNFYRTLLIAPWAIPAFISVLMWQGLLWPDSGVINSLLGTKINWLGDPNLARFSVLMVNIWLGFPFFMTLCLGALQSIPSELFEAAGVDGASKFQQFLKITVPSLAVTLFPAAVMSFAFNFNQFLSIYLLTAGLPPVAGSRAGATDILVTYSYKLAFTLFKYGLACAYAVIIFIVIAGICAINFQTSGTFKEAK